MSDHPPAAELLGAVARFLREEAVGQMIGRSALHARIAASVLDIVRREMAMAPAAREAETARLAALLGHAGSRANLNRELCEKMGAGAIDIHDPRLVGHLWATTLEAIAIDQPNYPSYRRIIDLGPAPKAH